MIRAIWCTQPTCRARKRSSRRQPATPQRIAMRKPAHPTPRLLRESPNRHTTLPKESGRKP